ncbi:MAG: DUF2934 domain-containing protein [Acidobacteriaceae bacterium]
MSAIRKPPSTIETPEQEIRLRAYELYEQRGGESGHDLDDWLQAEAELNTPQRKAIAA